VFDAAWVAPPPDQSAVPPGAGRYDWDRTTGLARRIAPGQAGGMHTVTGLAHDRDSHVAYDPESNEDGLRARSLKLAALQRTLAPPAVVGGDEGDLLIVGWGSTKGAIEEAAARLRDEGARVSSMHLRFLQPLPPGIGEAMARFRKVLTIESNWSDRPDDAIIDGNNRRYSALAMMLRARFLVDVDCWSQVRGAPIRPGAIVDAIRPRVQP
jgi:2-oxoglutarate ferredoxin oxidoreductase subunit alpha